MFFSITMIGVVRRFDGHLAALVGGAQMFPREFPSVLAATQLVQFVVPSLFYRRSNTPGNRKSLNCLSLVRVTVLLVDLTSFSKFRSPLRRGHSSHIYLFIFLMVSFHSRVIGVCAVTTD